MSKAKLGKKHNYIITQEHKDKISKANKGRFVSNETRKKIAEANRNRIVSERTRLKMSLSFKSKSKTEQDLIRAKMSAAKTGIIRSEETRAKSSKALKGRKPSQACLDASRKANTGRIQNRQSIKQNILNGKKTKITTSKYIGVCFDKYAQKWRSYLQLFGKIKYFGHFISEIEAVLARENFIKTTYPNYESLGIVLNLL